jgi:hypothetical protein
MRYFLYLADPKSAIDIIKNKKSPLRSLIYSWPWWRWRMVLITKA